MTNTIYATGTVLWLAALYDITSGQLVDQTVEAIKILLAL